MPPTLPANFNEDDRSFLDTGLLNIRYSLLNYVTRAITGKCFVYFVMNFSTITGPVVFSV